MKAAAEFNLEGVEPFVDLNVGTSRNSSGRIPLCEAQRSTCGFR